MFSENVILIDADYIDNVAFNLTVNFERMLGRRIPKADLANWLDCIALDGGLQPSDGQNIQVIFLHNEGITTLDNFTPSHLTDEINGKAFRDNMGEFCMEAYSVKSEFTSKEDFYIDTMQVLLDNEKVKNIMLIPDCETYGSKVCKALKQNKKSATLFAMEPQSGIGFMQQILGFSLTCALGVRSEEFN